MTIQWSSLGSERQHFLIHLSDGVIFYAPLAGVILLLPDSAAAVLREHFCSEPSAEKSSDNSLITYLRSLDALDVRPNPSERSREQPWQPISLTISTTQKCTLRCTYCYAQGGRMNDTNIPDDMVRDAVDVILHNSTVRGKSPHLSFIGEGEATANWKGFVSSIAYFKSKCNEHGLEGTVSMSTNGVMSPEKISFIASNVDSVDVSLDGLAEAHDANRILPNGEGSFGRVIDFIKRLNERGARVSIRASIADSACSQLSDFVHFIGQNLLCRRLHIEPISDVSSLTGVALDDLVEERSEKFIQAFRVARRTAALYNLELYYSGARTSVTDSFCGASGGRLFMITSEGIVTSCNEVLYEKDERSSLFHYGKWTAGKGFEISPDRLKVLRTLNTEHISKCQSCFAKYNCAGDCYAKTALTYGQPWETPYTVRCNINRELLKDELLLKVLSVAAKQISDVRGEVGTHAFSN